MLFGIDKLKWIISGGTTGQESIRNGVYNLEGKLSDDDIVIISSCVCSYSTDGYGILEDGEIKAFIANMTKLTICAVGHVNDNKSETTFHSVFDFDAKTPSLAGVRLREWLLAFKTIPENSRVE